jgi:hypothetical protein
MPVRNYHYPLRNIPEERASRLLRPGSLKSRIGYLNCSGKWRVGKIAKSDY